MREYRELTTQAALDGIDRRRHSFHDALLKEVRTANRCWIAADATMSISDRTDARLLVQSQRDLRAAEFVAIAVRSIAVIAGDAVWSGHIELHRVAAPVERTEVRFLLEGALDLACDRLFVAERPVWHGPAGRLDGEVPAPDAVPARDLGHACRQCTACMTPFDAAGPSRFQFCPNCAALTMLTDGA